MNTINVYILKASVKEIIFSPVENSIFINNLIKDNIKLLVNNSSFLSFTLLKDDVNSQYLLTINKDTPLDYHDVILFSVHTATSSSDIYVIYLHQMFYLGEALNLLPLLPINSNEDITISTELIKINNEDLSLISGSSSYLSGLNAASTFDIPTTSHVNEDIPLNFVLKNVNNNVVPDSDYLINIKVTKKSS